MSAVAGKSTRNKIKITVYEDGKGEHRWRMERGGRIVADSGEGYGRRDSARKAAANFASAINRGQYFFAPISVKDNT